MRAIIDTRAKRAGHACLEGLALVGGKKKWSNILTQLVWYRFPRGAETEILTLREFIIEVDLSLFLHANTVNKADMTANGQTK